jgi:hypothetical protein
MDDSTKDSLAINTTAAVLGAAAGAISKHAVTPTGHHGRLAMQVGSAVGAAAATGAGVSGSVAAGAAVVTAKVAAVAAAGAAAAPFVLAAGALGALGYGLFKLFED